MRSLVLTVWGWGFESLNCGTACCCELASVCYLAGNTNTHPFRCHGCMGEFGKCAILSPCVACKFTHCVFQLIKFYYNCSFTGLSQLPVTDCSLTAGILFSFHVALFLCYSHLRFDSSSIVIQNNFSNGWLSFFEIKEFRHCFVCWMFWILPCHSVADNSCY